MENRINKIFTSTVKARIGGCDNRAVIAETENGKIYCLHHQGHAHGFIRYANALIEDEVGRDIAEFKPPMHKIFEVEKMTSRSGANYYQALQNQY